jgi:alcohol dehydrogenase, propanol-preferring
MRALQMTGVKREPEYRDVADPTPGPGQVLVRIGGAGACHSDLHLFHDFEQVGWDLPFTVGHENAGWVEALGAGVGGLEIGQAVAVYGPWGCGRCVRCLQGMENYCERVAPGGSTAGGLGADGGMASLMLVPSARHLVPLDSLDPVEAAPLTDAGLTPYHAIKRSLHLMTPGSTVAVIGAGGLGHIAVQILAALTAATVVVVDQKPEALDLAAAHGAHHTVQAGDEALPAIMEISKGRGVDVTLDFVGVDSTLALAAQLTRSLGHAPLVGIGGGSHPFSFFTSRPEVSFASTYWGSIPELHEVIALAERGLVRPLVQRFDLDHAVDAYRALHEGRLTGRAVIVP